MNSFICFPNGKCKALTLSYDDGRIQDERLIDIFDRYGIRATFNLSSGFLEKDFGNDMFNRVKKLYSNHEVASHTCTHPTLERCSMSMVTEEIMNDRRTLEKCLSEPVRGFAYPNGSYNDEIKKLLRQLDIAYARTTENDDSLNLPKDWYSWQPTCHHNDIDLMNKAKSFVEFNKRQYLKLMYVWGHSYEFERDNNWQIIEEFCRYVGGRDDIWYCTNIEFHDYMEASRNLKFSADHSKVLNLSAITVYLNTENNDTVVIPPGVTGLP